MGSKRDVERAQRLLRRIDLEEVLEDLGMEVLGADGADLYCECPDPSHSDRNPSFHVCVEDVRFDGVSKLGWFSCWSHPEPGLRGRNFLDLVARVRWEIWDRWPKDAERSAAAKWLRSEYVSGDSVASVHAGALIRRKRVTDSVEAVQTPLRWPPGKPALTAGPEFTGYLEKRGITAMRAADLGVLGVRAAGDDLRSCLRRTLPAVLFPIRWGGEIVSWYARCVYRVPSHIKGRYAPGRCLPKSGVMWITGDPDFTKPAALVEGIFDAERVRALLLRTPADVPPGNVYAVLGSRLYPEQAASLRVHPRLIHLADGDDGGKHLWGTVEAQLGSFVELEHRPLGEGKDPGDAPREMILGALAARTARTVLRVRIRPGIRRI